MENILVTNFNGHNFFEFSELLYRDVHDLHLPVRILSSVHADSRAPLLFTDNDNNEGVHFVEKTRLCVVCKVSRLYMNFDEALIWNYKSTSNADLRR
jgi:hypothetical protein